MNHGNRQKKTLIRASVFRRWKKALNRWIFPFWMNLTNLNIIWWMENIRAYNNPLSRYSVSKSWMYSMQYCLTAKHSRIVCVQILLCCCHANNDNEQPSRHPVIIWRTSRASTHNYEERFKCSTEASSVWKHIINDSYVCDTIEGGQNDSPHRS